MDFQLLAFVTVAEERNFTRAAERLLTSQPSISQHIQNLELRFGAKLLERSNKYVRLNKAGEIVYHYAKEILRQYEMMERLVDDLSHEAHGSLSIGASYTFGEYVLPHILAAFCATYPEVVPSVTIANTTDVVEKVRGGAMDIGVIEGTHENDGEVEVESFAEDRVVVVANHRHRWAHGDIVPASQLEQERWIVREQGSGTREVTDRVFQDLGIRPTSVLEFGSTQAIKESVEAGLGVTVLSNAVIRKELQLQTLRIIAVADDPVTRRFSVVTRKSHFQTETMRLFRRALMEYGSR